MIPVDLIALGVSFYDEMRRCSLGHPEAAHAAVCYMRRKDGDPGDSMPYYEALAFALSKRAAERIAGADVLAQLAPEGGKQ